MICFKLFDPLKNWKIFSVVFLGGHPVPGQPEVRNHVILVLNDTDYCNNAVLLYIVYTGSCGIIYTDKGCKNTDFKIIVKSVVIWFV